MAVKHITENEVQAYLDSGQHLDSSTLKHIAQCEICSARVQQYEILFTALSEPPEMTLSEHFEDAVLGRVGLKTDDNFAYKFSQILLLTAACVSGVAISLYSIGLGGVSLIIANINKTIALTGQELGSVQLVQQNYKLFLLSVLAVSSISLLDKIYIARLRR